MRQKTDLSDDDAPNILDDLLSVNHGWWCDYIEEYTDNTGERQFRLAGRPYYSPAFLRMYGYSAIEMNMRKIVRDRKTQLYVLRGIQDVIRPGSKGRSGRMVVQTQSGEKKLVEAYLRRIDRPDGTALLASLHSDLTISSEVQWIERNVLDKLQAFVFVKRWDPVREKFIFTHMNDKLVGVLEPDEEKLTKCLLSDDDFFEDWSQKRAFRENDETIRDTNNADLVIMREETFDPKPYTTGPKSAQRIIPRRLLTFKTPLSIPSRSSQKNGWDVLGIAIDITTVTDVLRSIAEKSESGLYIKDDKRRYHYVNDKFLELLNAPGERQILDRTFAEALRELRDLGTGPRKKDIDRLGPLIEIEDDKVFSGKRSEQIREMELPIATDWLTIKQPIESNNRGYTHLLGITSPVFPGRLSEILNKLPQCISVKKYYPEERGQPGEFKLVWANRSFLDIHGKMELAEIIGKTDADLWPSDAEQVAEFRRRDRFVVESYQKLRSGPEWIRLSPREQWFRVVQDLQGHEQFRCWEYRETTRSRTRPRVLQTTKWAEEICGTLFVVVVYSDVTRGDVEQELYHRMTTHTLKSATGPIGNARIHLEKILRDGREPINGVQKAIACLDDTSHAIDLFLLYHLKLLRMDVKCRTTYLHELVAGIDKEAEKIQRNWGVKVDVGEGWPGAEVWCDVALLQFVIAELLLNASKSTGSRLNVASVAKTPYDPHVVVRFEQGDGEVRCYISDNGWACSNPDSRNALYRSFSAAQVDPYNRDSLSFGLPFCVVAVRAQGGQLVLSRTTEEFTEILIRLPVIAGGVIT